VFAPELLIATTVGLNVRRGFREQVVPEI